MIKKPLVAVNLVEMRYMDDVGGWHTCVLDIFREQPSYEQLHELIRPLYDGRKRRKIQALCKTLSVSGSAEWGDAGCFNVFMVSGWFVK